MSCRAHSTYRTGCIPCRRSRTGGGVPYVQNPHAADTPPGLFWPTGDSSTCTSSDTSVASSSSGSGSSGGR